MAALIGGARYPANSGYKVDCGPDDKHPNCRFLAQSKEVTRMSLEEITSLAEMIDREAAVSSYGRGLLGIVALKVRRGKGKPSPTLVVMTSETFTTLIGYTPEQPS